MPAKGLLSEVSIPPAAASCWRGWLFCELMGQLCLAGLRSVCREQEEKHGLVRAHWHTGGASPISRSSRLSLGQEKWILVCFLLPCKWCPRLLWLWLFEHVQSHTMALTHAKRVRGCSGWTGEMQAADVPVLRSWVLPNLHFPAAQGSLMWEHCSSADGLSCRRQQSTSPNFPSSAWASEANEALRDNVNCCINWYPLLIASAFCFDEILVSGAKKLITHKINSYFTKNKRWWLIDWLNSWWFMEPWVRSPGKVSRSSLEKYFNMVKDHPFKKSTPRHCQKMIQATRKKVTLFCLLKWDLSPSRSCFNPLLLSLLSDHQPVILSQLQEIRWPETLLKVLRAKLLSGQGCCEYLTSVFMAKLDRGTLTLLAQGLTEGKALVFVHSVSDGW